MNRFDLPVITYAERLSEALLTTANAEAERIVAAGKLVADTVARERGLKVVAITNLEQSRRQASRHPSGQRLFELADVALDNHAPPGEALLELPGLTERVASVGTITGAYLINALLAVAVQELIARGAQPPVIVSENSEDDSAPARNAALRQRYQGRLRRAGV